MFPASLRHFARLLGNLHEASESYLLFFFDEMDIRLYACSSRTNSVATQLAVAALK